MSNLRHELLSDPKCRCLRVSGHDLGCPRRTEGPYRNGLWTVGEESTPATPAAPPVQIAGSIAYREWSAGEYDQASRPGAKDPFDPDPRALEPAKNGWVWCERCESPRDLASREHDCNGEFR
jgi:hypothetical protein